MYRTQWLTTLTDGDDRVIAGKHMMLSSARATQGLPEFTAYSAETRQVFAVVLAPQSVIMLRPRKALDVDAMTWTRTSVRPLCMLARPIAYIKQN